MLSVAQVSGIIAAAVIIVQYVLPAGLVLMLVAHSGNENTAATWSSINRTISNTVWPLILGADSVGNRSRSGVALFVTWLMTLSAILVAIAGITAPIGLRDDIVAGVSESAYFQFAKDESAWGRVTMPRPNRRFGRYCEFGRRINCPGQFNGVDFLETEPGTLESVRRTNDSFLNTEIPENFTSMFSSATSDAGNTLSGLFDMQYRRYTLSRVDLVDDGEPRVQGDFRFIENLIPEDEILIREGVIVDMRENPGVGLRNHTVPIDLQYGGTWSEDLTWIEPVTQCVDTNLTIEIETVDDVEEFGTNGTIYLIDRGAFRDLDRGVLEAAPWGDNQTLDLVGRAYRAARMWNVFAADVLNVSLPLDSSDGRMPRLEVDMSINSTQELDSLIFSELDAELINVWDIRGLGDSFSDNNRTIEPPDDFVDSYRNGSRKLFASNYTAIDHICRGFYVLDDTSIDRRATNISNPAVTCGLLIGSGRSKDAEVGVAQAPSEDGVEVQQKDLYICASGMKASVKTVDFRYNGTGVSLENLKVDHIYDKVYRDEESKPLWGVEHSEPERMTFDPLWGIVSDEYENADGIYTMRSEHLWLPTTVSQLPKFDTRVGFDSLAAVAAPVLMMETAFSGSTTDNEPYLGGTSYPVVERFNRLSTNESSVSQIPRLIMTDSLASMVVGTKTAIRVDPVEQPAQLAVNDPIRRLSRAHVTKYKRSLGYDLRYAIPGVIALGLLALILLWAIILLIFRRRLLATLRDMYNQTSAGRLAATLLCPGRSDPNEPTKRWVRGDGKLVLKFGRIGNHESNLFVAVPEESRMALLAPEQQHGIILETVAPKR